MKNVYLVTWEPDHDQHDIIGIYSCRLMANIMWGRYITDWGVDDMYDHETYDNTHITELELNGLNGSLIK